MTRWGERDSFPTEQDFDWQTGRLAPPTTRRPDQPFVRFRNERDLRDMLGPAGPGREWHHIVEERLAASGRFRPEEIHNTDKIINLPIEVHRRVSARMSMRERSFSSQILRHRVAELSFADQYNEGLALIERVAEELGYELL